MMSEQTIVTVELTEPIDTFRTESSPAHRKTTARMRTLTTALRRSQVDKLKMKREREEEEAEAKEREEQLSNAASEWVHRRVRRAVDVINNHLMFSDPAVVNAAATRLENVAFATSPLGMTDLLDKVEYTQEEIDRCKWAAELYIKRMCSQEDTQRCYRTMFEAFTDPIAMVSTLTEMMHRTI